MDIEQEVKQNKTNQKHTDSGECMLMQKTMERLKTGKYLSWVE